MSQQRDLTRPMPPRKNSAGKAKSQASAMRSRRSHSPQNPKAKYLESKWMANRYSMPYRTDGPKLTLGVIWFICLFGAAAVGYARQNPLLAAVAICLVCSPVTAVAGLQSAFAWFPSVPPARTWSASIAGILPVIGLIGPQGVPIAAVIGVLAATMYAVVYRGHRRNPTQMADVMIRCSVPAGVAMAALVAIATMGTAPGVAIVMILTVSAFEVGDYIVGTGAMNAIEGPLAGFVSMSVICFIMFTFAPAPFTPERVIVAGVLTAITCPAGKLLASTLLPHGFKWAPALRRVDSYLITAPAWLLMLAVF